MQNDPSSEGCGCFKHVATVFDRLFDFTEGFTHAIGSWPTLMLFLAVVALALVIRTSGDIFFAIKQRPPQVVENGPYRTGPPIQLSAPSRASTSWHVARLFVPPGIATWLAFAYPQSLVPPFFRTEFGWTLFYALTIGLFIGRSFRMTDEARKRALRP